jgi:hypothetical protein
LAVLHAAQLTVTCADALNGGETLVLDGTFLKEPLFAPVVAALRPNRRTVLSDEPHGVVVGATRLAVHETRSMKKRASLEPVVPIAIPGLAEYFMCWRSAAEEKGRTSHD